MRAIARITWKDLLVIFRDRTALILMLAGPLLLTLGMGLVTGAFNSDSDGENLALPTIALLVVNEDEGLLGDELVRVLESPELGDLLRPQAATDPEAAQTLVATGGYAAAVIIPPGFSATVLGGRDDPANQIAVYVDPGRTISGGVVRSIVEEFLRRVDLSQAAAAVGATSLMGAGVAPEAIGSAANRLAVQAGETEWLTVQTTSLTVGEAATFNPLAYFAPAMALLFLMYTVTIGARSFLAERQQRTLARMMAAPLTTPQILGGKVLGIFLSGVAQVGLLVGLSALLFGLRWGSPLGVALLILAAAAAATGWGLLVAAVANTPGQISTIGSTLMLSFGILGGSFVPLNQSSSLLQALSKITPNAWALDGFSALATGGTLNDLLLPLSALALMAVTLFAVAALIFRRRQTSLVA